MIQLSQLTQDTPDQLDIIYRPTGKKCLPSVDLKPWADEVENQLKFNSCTAHAAASAIELLYARGIGLNLEASRAWLYWHIRRLGGIVGDKGAYPRDICKALYKIGFVTEDLYPYNQNTIDNAPDEYLLTIADRSRISSYARIEDACPQNGNTSKLDGVKDALNEGMPVLLCTSVGGDWINVKGGWKTHSVRYPYEAASGNQYLGLHETLIIGYDDAAGRLLIENSWGPEWGDGGFFGMTYDHFMKTALDCWVITGLKAPIVPVRKDLVDPPTPEPTQPPEPIIVVPPDPVQPEPKGSYTKIKQRIAVALLVVIAVVTKHYGVW